MKQLLIVLALLLVGTNLPASADLYSVTTSGTTFTSPANGKSVSTYVFARDSWGYTYGTVSLLNATFRLAGSVRAIVKDPDPKTGALITGLGSYYDAAQGPAMTPCTFKLRVKKSSAAYRLGAVSVEVNFTGKPTVWVTGTGDGTSASLVPFRSGNVGIWYIPTATTQRPLTTRELSIMGDKPPLPAIPTKRPKRKR